MAKSVKVEEGNHYTTSKWKGRDEAETEHTNYECTECQFSTLFPDRMQLHWDNASKHKHVWAYPEGEKPEIQRPETATKKDVLKD